jgi:phosphinothricin acetyltransferase
MPNLHQLLLAFRTHEITSVETSVYLAPDAIGQGIGGRLYDTLLAELVDSEAHHVVAAVALPNDASVALHLSRQFTVVGTFTDYAIKRGRRVSSTWFERPVRMQGERS